MVASLRVDRLNVEDLTAAHRQGEQVAVLEVVGAFPQATVAGDLIGGHHGVLSLLRSLSLGVGGQNPDGDLAVVVGVGGHRHVRR